MSQNQASFAPEFAEIAMLRNDLGSRLMFRDEKFLMTLANRLTQTEYLRRQPIVEAFLEDLRNFSTTGKLNLTKKFINEKRGTLLISLFDASYFPTLSLDMFCYETLPTNEHLSTYYASPTMPVNIVSSSPGFEARVVVALFPENHLDGQQSADDLIFYFINKFVDRHNKITRKLILAVTAENSFPLLREATDDEIEQASSWWVRLHEYHHRQGDMPIPQYLKAKSYKPLAGLEELRVDVSAMLVCLQDTRLPSRMSALTFEYILAERLLRYSVEGIPKPNYDAVASQLLFNYLLQSGGIRLQSGVIQICATLPDCLAEFLREIQEREHFILSESVESVRGRLLDFTDAFTDFDQELNDYRHIPFFAELKSRLNV